MLNNLSRTVVRSIAVAAAVALAFGSTATPVRAADLDPIPTPDFTVVAAWADTTAATETDYVLVKDAAGLHRFAGNSWTAVNLPASVACADAGCSNVSIGRVSGAGVASVLSGQNVALYNLRTNAADSGSGLVLPADAEQVSANATLVVYQAGGSWFSWAYGDADPVAIPAYEVPITVIAGADSTDEVYGSNDADRLTVVGASNPCTDDACTTRDATQVVVAHPGDAPAELRTIGEVAKLEAFDAAGGLVLTKISYRADQDYPNGASGLWVTHLRSEPAWAVAQDVTLGSLVSFTPNGVLTGTTDDVFTWFPISLDSEGTGALSFAGPETLDTTGYTGLAFVANQSSGTPVTKYTDSAGVVGLARVSVDAKHGASLVEITHLVVDGTQPRISGKTVFGETLSADAGTWAPADAALTYQWYAGGVAIADATGSNYTLTAAEIGKLITVTVTGAKTGYVSDVETSEATLAVTDIAPGTVAISGTAAVGQALSTTLTGWPAGATFAYQWQRGTTVVGTGATYTVAAADAGSQLTVTVTATLTGHSKLVATSAGVNIAAAGKQFAAAPRPVILGSARVGGVLVALPGLWRPVPVKLSIQWYRGGVAIAGATKVIYRPTQADRGSRITVALTGSKSGYVPTTKVSAPTGTIR
jgi:hypothetical protein